MKIKFRAWDKLREEMLPVKLMDFGQWWVTCDPSHGTEGKASDYGERNSFSNEESDRHILMQYTGLKDINKKEVYDQDIVRQARDVCIIEKCIGGFQRKMILGPHEGSTFAFSFLGNRCVVDGNVFEDADILSE